MVITEEQRKERVNYLGGSDAAAILGLSRFKTPLQVFMAKVHPKHDESESRIGGKNEPAYWGNKLEDKVCEGFTEATGKKLYRVNKTIIHPEHDFIRANIDRMVVKEDAGMEGKTCTLYKAKEWEGEEMPIEYIIQCQHYLGVTGWEFWYLACLIGGQKLIWKVIPRDEILINKIITAEVNFWNDFVIPKQPPMVTGSDRDSQLLDRLYPEAAPGIGIELPEEYSAMIESRDKLKEEIDERKVAVDEIENKIKAEIKDNESGRIGQYLITWKNQDRSGIDQKKLKEGYPDVFQAVQKISSSRYLRFKELKGVN